MFNSPSAYRNNMPSNPLSVPVENLTDTSLDYRESILDNSVRVLTSRMVHTNAVSSVFMVGAGSRYETDDEAGVSHLFEHMLFKGTNYRPRPRDITGVIESVGGTINAFTDRECTAYWCRMALPHYRRGLDVLSDIIKDPLFRESDIAQEKHVVQEEIRASNDSPGAQAELLLDSALWPDQALGRDIAGSVESVDALSRELMLDYHRSQYVGRNLVVAVAGNVDHDAIVQQLDESLSGLPDSRPRDYLPYVDNLEGPSLAVEPRELEQLHVSMAFRGVSLVDPRRTALRVLSVVLGGSMSSRLFEEVREKRGLAYGIGSSMHSLSDCGSFDIHTGVEPPRAIEAIEVIVDELVKIRDGVTAEELNDARELAKGRMLLGMEESRQVALDLAMQALLLGDIQTIEDRIDDLDEVDLDDVKDIAQDVINSGKFAMSAVGPVDDAARIEGILKF